MIKAIIATILGAAVTAGVVYVAMNTDMMDKLGDNGRVSSEREAYDNSSESKSKIDELVKTPVKTNDDTSTDETLAGQDDSAADDMTDAADLETKVMVTTEVMTPATNTQDLPGDVKLNPKPNLVTVNGGDIEEALDEDISPAAVPEDTEVDITQPASPSEMSQPQATVPNRLIDEADKITEPRMRDQAYLSIVDYGIGISDFKGAAAVIEKIDNTEYRFTAQSNLAQAYARAGDADSAFAVVSSIQDDQFADIVRMQVIESLSGR